MTQPAPRIPAQEPWKRPLIRAWGVCLLVWAALFGLTLLFGNLTTGRWSPTGDALVLTNLGLWSARLVLLGAWIGGTVWLVRTTRPIAPVLALTFVVLVASVFMGGLALFFSTPVHVHDRLTSRTGRELRALFLPGFDDRQGIGEMKTDGLFHERIAVLHVEECYGGQGGAFFIPERRREREHLWLHELTDGTVAIAETTQWISEGGALFALTPGGARPPHGPVARVEADDVGQEDQVAHVERGLRLGQAGRPIPTQQELEDALLHESAWVRSTADRLLRVLRESPHVDRAPSDDG